MTEDAIKMRWVKWVLRGEGRGRSLNDERYSYNGPVLYSNGWPAARLVQMTPMKWCLLTKTGVYAYSPKEWKTGIQLADRIHVPCIGMFSRYPDDMLSDSDLHERIRWLSHLEAQSIIENVQTWPAHKLLVKPKYGKPGFDQLGREMENCRNRYRKYNEAFGLCWAEWPDHYDKDFTVAINARRKDYFDPKAIATRERAAARKQAKQALGVE